MKVGIMSFYYQSTNFGGNLQAYALVKVLCSLGYDAEQVCYRMENWRTIDAPETPLKRIRELTPKRVVYAIARRMHKRYWRVVGKEEKWRNAKYVRMSAFYNFNQVLIRHSEEVYDDSNIIDTNNIYDIFITGSDQVWNPDCYLQPFYLDFVQPSKKKIAYAASLAKDKLSEKELTVFREFLKTFDAISVREKVGAELLKDVSPVKVFHLLDPTLLLDGSEWERLCEADSINDNYIFCYFLGSNTKVYHSIKKFARDKHLKIVNIPYMANTYFWNSEHLGDISIIDAGPHKFLTLIKNAEYIFTDSFHAIVFSWLFKKQFFVFNRDMQHDINERIYDFLGLVNLVERFCDTNKKEKCEYFLNLNEIDYGADFKEFEDMKKLSVEFLKLNLPDSRRSDIGKS